VCDMRLLLRVPRPLGTFGVDARAFVLLLPVRDLKGRPLVLCVSEDAMSVNKLGTFSLTMRCAGEGERLKFLEGDAAESRLPTLSMSSSLGSSYLTAFFATLLTPLPVLGLRSTSSSSSSSAKLSSSSLLALLSSSMSSSESPYACLLARFLAGRDDAPLGLRDRDFWGRLGDDASAP
jgi:hypothetical protein